MRKYAEWLISAALLLGLGLAVSWAQVERTEIPQEAQAALQYFLDVDCEVDAGSEPLDRLLKYKDVLQARLITLLKEGPDASALASFEPTLEQRWAQRQAFLGQEPELGLKEEELQLATGVTKEQYLRQGRQQFIRKYREKAAVALAAIGTPEARKVLEEVRLQADEGLRAVIQSAREKFRRR